jgi:hypothetical protein
VAAPDRRAANPAGKQAADPGRFLTGAVVVPRDTPTVIRLGGQGSSIRRPAHGWFSSDNHHRITPHSRPRIPARPFSLPLSHDKDPLPPVWSKNSCMPAPSAATAGSACPWLVEHHRTTSHPRRQPRVGQPCRGQACADTPAAPRRAGTRRQRPGGACPRRSAVRSPPAASGSAPR